MNKQDLTPAVERAAEQGLVWPDNRVVLHMHHDPCCESHLAAGPRIEACTCTPELFCLGTDRLAYWWSQDDDAWLLTGKPYPGATEHLGLSTFSPN